MSKSSAVLELAAAGVRGGAVLELAAVGIRRGDRERSAGARRLSAPARPN